MSVVVVTGATRGIGNAVVRRIVASGDTVIGVARDGRALEAMRTELGDAFVPMPADLGDRATRALAVAEILRRAPALPTGFVSAAGNAVYRHALDVDAATIDAHVDLHVVAAFEIARDLAKSWITADTAGSVVFLGSTLATRPAPFTLPYAIAKGALDAMVRGLALELAERRIRVNAVSPGVVDTELVRAARPDAIGDTDPQARLDALAKVHPLGRLGRADEVAATVLHVLHAEWMTGTSVVLDGGLSLV